MIMEAVAVEVDLRIQAIEDKQTAKQFYSVDEFSTITGLTKLAIQGRRNRGTLKFANDSTSILIPASELNRILKKLNDQL